MYDSQKGFTLIEVMVGLVIGLLGTVIVAQAFTNNEARKRATTGTADAQANGGIALYMLERDAKAAGWGMTATNTTYPGCTTIHAYCNGSATCGGTNGPLGGINFAPVLITDGGSNPDTLTIQYFADPNVASGLPSGTTVLRRRMQSPSAELDVASASACMDGDLALVAAPTGGNCTVMKITEVQEQAAKLQHTADANGEYNPAPEFYTTNTWPVYEANSTVSCFKPANGGPIFRKVYSVNSASRELQRSDNSQNPAAVNELVMTDVVDMQAQYGVSAAISTDAISAWVNPADAGWTNPGPNDWRRIKAIRLALVTRSGQYERPAAGANCSATTSLATSWGAISTANYPNDWGCYRYRVFETVIPLRNVIWGHI
ncbi:PilW family protein [Duganella sp. Root198D2]|uniref:PilW family protein n=1 Tax=Duganella sp. Root198D2 TaxID=1736489 RepID=UPI00070E9685|nr:PilW family protein [Duganella sp. Root198D2]